MHCTAAIFSMLPVSVDIIHADKLSSTPVVQITEVTTSNSPFIPKSLVADKGKPAALQYNSNNS